MEDKVKELQEKINHYEQNGSAKLFYAISRKMSEMADLLNGTSLKTIDIVSKADASFERVFKLLEKSEMISNAAKSLGDFAGVTGDEQKDINKKPFVDTIAESRR